MSDSHYSAGRIEPAYFDLGQSKQVPKELSRVVNALLGDIPRSRAISLLEAGGGSSSRLSLDRPLEITTIDISPEQIERNDYAQNKIVGDLEVYDYGDQSFDASICYNVIEHLSRPEMAITRIAEATRPGGLLIVAAPDCRSLKGLITKFSPHWFHVLFYRIVMRNKDAGKPGHAPFPTFLRPICTASELSEFLRGRGFETEYSGGFVANQILRLRQRLYPGYLIYLALSGLVRAATGGRYGGKRTDFFLVARKRPDPVQA